MVLVHSFSLVSACLLFRNKTKCSLENVNNTAVHHRFSQKRERKTPVKHPSLSRTYFRLKETSCLFWFSLKIRQHVHLHSYRLCVLSVNPETSDNPPGQKNTAVWQSLYSVLILLHVPSSFLLFSASALTEKSTGNTRQFEHSCVES